MTVVEGFAALLMRERDEARARIASLEDARERAGELYSQLSADRSLVYTENDRLRARIASLEAELAALRASRDQERAVRERTLAASDRERGELGSQLLKSALAHHASELRIALALRMASLHSGTFERCPSHSCREASAALSRNGGRAGAEPTPSAGQSRDGHGQGSEDDKP